MKQAFAVICTGIFSAFLPFAAQAHPHVFVDTELSLEVDQSGRLIAVDVTWSYDAFYSLLVLEDRGFDSDFDGVLTASELQQMQGFDLMWVDGFAGDLFVSQGGQLQALSPPEHLGTGFEDGRLISRHRRAVAAPVGTQELLIEPYDPTYYTAYALSSQVEIVGAGRDVCSVQVTPPDLNAAYSKLEELLYATPQEAAEEAYPEIGAAFASVVTLSCGGAGKG